jgi:hypothetical protein
MTGTDVPEEDRLAEAVVRGLRKGAGASDGAAAIVEPITRDVPVGNLSHEDLQANIIVPQLVAESGDDQMSTENLSTLLGKVSDTSTGKIDNLIGDFEGLRRKLQTDRERIQREIEEYNALSQQVMQLTKIISEGVQKLPAVSRSLDS